VEGYGMEEVVVVVVERAVVMVAVSNQVTNHQ
jgi:hypothetical protein